MKEKFKFIATLLSILKFSNSHNLLIEIMKKIMFLNLILVSNILLAQTGPGGVGSSTTNGLWLRADNLNQTNATAVSSWPDASGNTNNAIEPTSSNQPTFYTTSSDLNSMPIVRFDGTNDEMHVPDADILDGTSGITFYAVLRPNNLDGTDPRGILGKRVSYTETANYAYDWYFREYYYLYLDVNDLDDRFNTGTTTFSNSTNYILSWDFDGTLTAANRSRLRSGSTEIIKSTESTTSLINSNQDLYIGTFNEGYPHHLEADYAEIIHFNYALNSAEHIIVQNYLSAKYAITITADYYTQDNNVNGDYDYDVAGIGRVDASNIHNDSKGSGVVRILNPTGLGDDEFLFWGHDNVEGRNITDVPTGVDARLDRVWRVSEVNSSGTAVDVGSIDIRWDLSENGSVTASDLRLLIDTDNDGLFNDETPISGASDLGGGIYAFTGVSGIADDLRFTLGTSDASTTYLPIELVNFNAIQEDERSVKLEWQTASEINNDFFTIERSINAIDWEIVKTIDGAGNSNTLINYSAIDNKPFMGLSYYRLKQTDFDGHFEYSAIKSVDFKELLTESVEIYPNPTDNKIQVIGSANELSEVHIFNLLGQDVSNFTTINRINESKITIDLSQLAKGVYYVKTRTSANNVYKE